MTKATPSPERLPTALACELQRLRNVVALAAFVADARRLLTEVDAVAVELPQAESVLVTIRDRRQWWELEDCTAFVLDDVCARLDELIERSAG